MKTILNEQPISNTLIPTKYKIENAEGDVPEVSFTGYSGQPVDLSDYGFDAPVVYDLSTMKVASKQIPLMYNHREEIGHSTRVVKSEAGSSLKGKGLLSVPSPKSLEVRQAMKNGFQYQASMGLMGDYDKITYLAKGETTVNNRVIKAPVYVWHNTELREMTLAVFGRDGDTNFGILNEERRNMIKNSAGAGPAPADPAPQTPPTPPAPVENTPPSSPAPAPAAPPAPAPVQNSDADARSLLVTALNRMSQYPQHPDLVRNSITENWDDTRLKNEVDLIILRNSRTSPPGNAGNPADRSQFLRARLYNSVGVSEEMMIKKFGDKMTEQVLNMGHMGLKELLVNASSLMGGHFTGFSDVELMCKFLKNSGYSTFDMPNLFLGAGETLLEQWWKLDAPFAPTACKEESNQDFKPTQHIRPEGGQVWEGLDKEGKLSHAQFGKEHFYTTELDTIGQYLQLTRKMIENDSMNMVQEMLRMMVEGAMIVPDIRLLKHLTEEDGTFFVDGTNSFKGASAALTRANLSTLYKKIRKMSMSKGKVDFRNILNTRWTLVVGVEQEETAWEIIQQEKIVQETGAANPSKTGEKNYWYKRLDVKTFAQIGNVGITTATNEDDWYLWPQEARFAPYTITYLRGRKRPTMEQVDVPGDMLGFAVRGYWDVEVNKRESTAMIRCRPSVS